MILRKVTQIALSISLGQHYIRGHVTLTGSHLILQWNQKIPYSDQTNAMMPQSAGYLSVQASLCWQYIGDLEGNHNDSNLN